VKHTPQPQLLTANDTTNLLAIYIHIYINLYICCVVYITPVISQASDQSGFLMHFGSWTRLSLGKELGADSQRHLFGRRQFGSALKRVTRKREINKGFYLKQDINVNFSMPKE